MRRLRRRQFVTGRRGRILGMVEGYSREHHFDLGFGSVGCQR
jgi:hypothetical protein